MYPGYGDDSAAQAAPAPSAAPAPATPPFAPMAPLPAPAPAVTPAAASRRAGASVVLAGGGFITGALLGGPWGAGSGLFFAGALSNALRSASLWRSDFADDRKEAVKTTVMTILGIGVGGYLGYRARQAREDD